MTRLLDLAAVPGEPPDLRRHKRVQTSMSLGSIPAIVVMGLLEGAVHGRWALLWPGVYVATTVAMLAWLAWTKRYDVYRWAHPLAVLLLPVALQEQVGGFVASGGAILWSVCAVVSALMFLERRAMWAWLSGYLVVVAATTVAEVGRAGTVDATDAELAVLAAVNGIGVTLFLFASLLHFVERLNEERDRSERLLRNVLPGPIATRLKRGNELIIADRHEAVTVLFCDLVGFTALSADMRPEALVDLLDEVFSALDALAEQQGLEKIKTIGDAYMVVSGAPEPRPDHAEAAARFALGVLSAIDAISERVGHPLAARVGLHSGEVVAGVIGRSKFAYDLWGDTVNTASRMESHGEPGRVQVSDATRALLGEAFTLERRGEVHVKGKGPMVTWWLVDATGQRRAPAAPHPTDPPARGSPDASAAWPRG